jgi:hypothetical protein
MELAHRDFSQQQCVPQDVVQFCLQVIKNKPFRTLKFQLLCAALHCTFHFYLPRLLVPTHHSAARTNSTAFS